MNPHLLGTKARHHNQLTLRYLLLKLKKLIVLILFFTVVLLQKSTGNYHDFSSRQSYHGIRMQFIRPVLRQLPCYLHRTYQVLCFNNTPFKVITVFCTQVIRSSMCKIPWYLHISYQGMFTSTSPGQSYHVRLYMSYRVYTSYIITVLTPKNQGVFR